MNSARDLATLFELWSIAHVDDQRVTLGYHRLRLPRHNFRHGSVCDFHHLLDACHHPMSLSFGCIGAGEHSEIAVPTRPDRRNIDSSIGFLEISPTSPWNCIVAVLAASETGLLPGVAITAT